ncbi:unnamed protein product [Heterobilharzia americana]|nr:unnamed protein product [Heterobilharzia americana]CAH8430041.1 unnamed protein product [Heterobilharzia americana]
MCGTEALDYQYRSLQINKMEQIIGRMNSKKSGIIYEFQPDPFLNLAFKGEAFVNWLQENIPTSDEHEAMHLANLFLFYGYIFRLTESQHPCFQLKNNHWYRFQAPFYWISNILKPNDLDYAVYLMKRNFKKGGFDKDDPEDDIFQQLSKSLADKWKIIELQAVEQIRLERKRDETDRNILNLQEKAFWRIHRPPKHEKYRLTDPPSRHFTHKQMQIRQEQLRRKTMQKEKFLKDIMNQNSEQDVNSALAQLQLDRITLPNPQRSDKKSLDSLILYTTNHLIYDNLLNGDSMDNCWFASEKDTTAWVEDSVVCSQTDTIGPAPYPTLKRARMWATSMDHLFRDPNGRKWLEHFMEKEYSCENMRFLQEVHKYKFGPITNINKESKRIYTEYLAKTGVSEINIDNYTLTATEELLKNPDLFCFDFAQEHIYNLVKNDSYTRFLRSNDYAKILNHALKSSSQTIRTEQQK